MTYLIPTRILLLLLFVSSLVAAANFTECLEDFRNSDPSTIGGIDSRGRPTTPAESVGLTYKTCTARCGSDAKSFRWNEFARSFSSWLLPWLALISQLPFGLGGYSDDFTSVVMSVGSPALAAYSLILTSLNVRSVYRRAEQIEHESKYDVARTLVSLQQTPLELTRDERLLVLIPSNDQWRQGVVDRLNSRNAKSVATKAFVGSVVMAFTLTLVDSFVSLNDSTDAADEGLAVGTVWLWLLCLVIGWLWVPTFTCGELNSAVGRANQKAAKRAAKRSGRAANKAHGSAKSKVTDGLSKRVSIPKGSKKPVVDPVPEVDEENEKAEVESIQEDTELVEQESKPEADPLPGPTHRHSTVSFQFPIESHHGHGFFSFRNPTATHSVVSSSRSSAIFSISGKRKVIPETDRLFIPKDTFSSLNRDEIRLAAMFNYSRIMRYLVLVDDVLRVLDELTYERDEKAGSIRGVIAQAPRSVVFPPGALTSMFYASIFALILHCGTITAAAIIVIFTPPIGVGCRSLGYLLYGAVAALILFLTVISTIFARISETRRERSTTVKAFAAFIAVTLRRISLLLAFINAAGLIVLCCFHFSFFLDNCYCNASVTGRGTDSYVIISYSWWVPTMRITRIVATVLAAVSMAIYMTSLRMINSLSMEIGY